MSYITSSELEHDNGSEYLHIYLDPQYGFTVKLNGEEISENELFIKAPTMTTKDVYDVRRVSSVVAKFEDIQNEKLSKELARLSDEERARLFSSIKDIEISDQSNIDFKEAVKDHLKNLVKSSRSFELDKDTFFSEFDKISHFLESRLSRKLEGNLIPCNFAIFDKYLGAKQFIIEAIFIEYVGFFSKHFPLESLQSLQGK